MLKLVTGTFKPPSSRDSEKDALGRRFRLPSGYPLPEQQLPLHFPEHWPSLQLRGGWGYHQDDSTELLPCSPVCPQREFDRCEMEDLFIRCRLEEESYHALAAGSRLVVKSWRKVRQRQLFSLDCYDVIAVEVVALPESCCPSRSHGCVSAGVASRPSALGAPAGPVQGERLLFRETFWFKVTDFH